MLSDGDASTLPLDLANPLGPNRAARARRGRPAARSLSATNESLCKEEHPRRADYRRSGILNKLAWNSALANTYVVGSGPIATAPCWSARTPGCLARAA